MPAEPLSGPHAPITATVGPEPAPRPPATPPPRTLEWAVGVLNEHKHDGHKDWKAGRTEDGYILEDRPDRAYSEDCGFFSHWISAASAFAVAEWYDRAGAAEGDRLRAAIAEHHAQRADDRCIEDDDRLYAAAGLPPCDRRVGDKAAMLGNCRRFIERRCQGGGWPSYAELERELEALRGERDALASCCRKALAAYDAALVRRPSLWSGADVDEMRAALAAIHKAAGPNPTPEESPSP
jgi:hypothetical protein